jgi:leader peptidase (prepilin peptidase)/N-methyltransferase
LVNAFAVSGFAVAGAFAGVPVAAIAFAAPTHGTLRVEGRWWLGEPARPPIVGIISLLTGTAAGLVAGCLPLSPALPAFWIFAVLSIGLAVIDLRHHRLPHAITSTIAIASIGCFTLAAALSGNPDSLLRAVATGAISAVVMLIVALAFPGQLGLGDVALAGAVTLNLGWLSWQAAAVGIFGALLLQAAAALVVKAKVRSDGITPMGPAFATGWLVSILLAGTSLFSAAS